MSPKYSQCPGLRQSLSLCLAILCALFVIAAPALGQSESEAAADEADVAESMAANEEMKPPVDLEAIAALEYGTYDTGWVRYLNGLWNQPILHVEGITQFPFRTVSLPGRVNMELLQDFDFLGALIEEYDLHIDEAALQGLCDTERMRKYQTTDVICIPGTSVMEPGLVITVMYHPESFVIVAVTTTIDNIGGIATRADEWRDLLVVAPADDAAPQPQGEGSCGPYNPGRWISAEEYEQSGLNLPISTAGSAKFVTHYVCMVEANGNAYLQAHPLASNQTSSAKKTSSVSDSGDDDDDDDDDSGGSGSGSGNGGSLCGPGQGPMWDYSTEPPTFLGCSDGF